MKIKTSRLYSLLTLDLVSFFFPGELSFKGGIVIKEVHESLIFFWDTRKDRLLLREVVSITHDPGIFWDTVEIGSRGEHQLILKGLSGDEAERFTENLTAIKSKSHDT